MRITFGSLTALRMIRAIRCGRISARLDNRLDLVAPDPSPRKRWKGKLLEETIAPFGEAMVLSSEHPLDVVVPHKDRRIQSNLVRNTVVSGDLPSGSFVAVDDSVAISCPELMFIELARVMDPVMHLLVGMELCGRFSRAARNPRNGAISYDIAPVTSVSKLRRFAAEAQGAYGVRRALETVDLIAENAWSPMEAVVAAVAVLPIESLGFDLGPVSLNPRKELGERLARLSDADSRVPDIMFTGTDVGLNYDGEDHFGLERVARAAVNLDRNSGDSAYAQELHEAYADVRARIVADKRRDRDLLSLGLTVFSITKEDLLERGGFERMMGQVVEAIERTERRDLTAQRLALANTRLADARFNLIRSLAPGSATGGVGVTMKDLRMSYDEAVARFEQGVDGPQIVSIVSG